MLIFLTFDMFVFLHDSRLVSISLGDYLTWFFGRGGKSEENPITYIRNGAEGTLFFS